MSGGADELEDLHALADKTADGGAMPAPAPPNQPVVLSEVELEMLDPGAERPGLTDVEIDTILRDLDAETSADVAAIAKSKWPRRKRTEEGKERRKAADARRKAAARAETKSNMPTAPLPFAALDGRVEVATRRAHNEAVIRRRQLVKAMETPGDDKVLLGLCQLDAPRHLDVVHAWLGQQRLRVSLLRDPSLQLLGDGLRSLAELTPAARRVAARRLLERAKHLEKVGVWKPFDLLARP